MTNQSPLIAAMIAAVGCSGAGQDAPDIGTGGSAGVRWESRHRRVADTGGERWRRWDHCHRGRDQHGGSVGTGGSVGVGGSIATGA